LWQSCPEPSEIRQNPAGRRCAPDRDRRIRARPPPDLWRAHCRGPRMKPRDWLDRRARGYRLVVPAVRGKGSARGGWLATIHPGSVAYQRTTKRLIPWTY